MAGLKVQRKNVINSFTLPGVVRNPRTNTIWLLLFLTNLWHFSTDFIFGGKSQMQYEKKLRIIFSSNCDLTLIHSFFCFWKKIIHTFIHSIFKLSAKIILAKHVNLHKKIYNYFFSYSKSMMRNIFCTKGLYQKFVL